MVSAQVQKAESTLAEQHEPAIAGDHECDAKNREADARAAARRDDPGDDSVDVDGARSTRLLLHRANAALARARALQDDEYDGIDVDGDLVLQRRCPRPVEG